MISFRCAALVSFPSVYDAAQTVVSMMSAPPTSLVRCELVNGDMIKATNIVYKTSLDTVPTLFLEFRAESEEVLLKDAHAFKDLCFANHGANWDFTQDATKFDELWNARRGT